MSELKGALSPEWAKDIGYENIRPGRHVRVACDVFPICGLTATMFTPIYYKGAEPFKKRDSDAGWDLRALTDATLRPGRPTLITLATRILIPDGMYGALTLRSNLREFGIFNAEGVIDSGYTGPLKITAINLGASTYQIREDDRVAQIVLHPYDKPIRFEPTDRFPETPRGTGGFGSTGRQ